MRQHSEKTCIGVVLYTKNFIPNNIGQNSNKRERMEAKEKSVPLVMSSYFLCSLRENCDVK